MKTKFTLSLLVLTLFLCNCCKKGDGSPANNESFVKINNYNVLIVPDLSNRIDPNLHPKPVHDTILIDQIADSIRSLMNVNNRQMNQLDVYKFDFINKGILNSGAANLENMEINFNIFKNKVRDASEFKRNSLRPAISKLKKEVSKVYQYSLQHPAGSDVWSYFNETINGSLLYEPEKIDEKEKIITGTKNLLVLFTDGYIESVNNGPGYIFDQQSVEKIRKDFLNSKSADLEKFISSNPGYAIKKTTNNLKDLHVLILEMVDRSLDKNGAATIQPTDFEIMKIVWTKWLKDSGASKVEIYPAFSKKTDAYYVLKKFMTEIK